MKLPIFQVDAFTSRLFGGNPAAVVLLEEWLPDDILQAVAAENNLSETAYVVPEGDRFGLRWFTPAAEVDLCGHATLATAFVLFQEGRVKGDTARFDCPSGALQVKKSGEMLVMDVPSRPPEPLASSEEVEAALGRAPVEVLAARDLMAVFERESDVAALEPEMDRIAGLEQLGVIATAPGDRVDFVSRFFAPKVGIPEDPVTGSAHCTLIPYWSSRLGKKKLRANQISKRGGELHCEDLGDRVSIGGRAVQYLRGEIFISPAS